MSKYIKKSFSPHIYQDWIHLFRQCSPEQRSELLLAITDFPNHEPEIEISIWDFIKSQLDTQYQSMENKSQQMSTNRNNKKQKSTDVNQSRPMSTEVDQSSQIEIETGIETRIETETKEKEISNDISKKNPIDFDTPFQAGGQFWVLPPQFRKLALTKYTESEIREFEKAHSCHENPEDVCLNDIKHLEPKKKQIEISDYGEYEPLREQITKWIEYKKARKESYKTEQSLMAFAKKLFTLSGGKPDIADQIIEQSMANNWAGIFELKQNQKKEKINFSFYTGEGSFLKPDGEW